MNLCLKVSGVSKLTTDLQARHEGEEKSEPEVRTSQFNMSRANDITESLILVQDERWRRA